MSVWEYDIEHDGLNEHDKSILMHNRGITEEGISAACKVARKHVATCLSSYTMKISDDDEVKKMLKDVERLKAGKDQEPVIEKLVDTPDQEQEGIPGPPCPICTNEFYIRNGTCLMCNNCGATTGCG